MSMSHTQDGAEQPLLPRFNSIGDAYGNVHPPDLTEEIRQWHVCDNLDVFFTRLYRYWQENGFAAIVAARLVNLAALAFTIAMAGFLLLVVNFSGLKDPCLHDNKCDIADAALYKHPLAHGSAFSTMFKLSFLGIFSLYWLWSAAVSAVEIWQLWDIKLFCRDRMGLSDTTLGHLPWPELLQRIVAVQRSVRLSLRGDLSQHDIVMRIMRKDDYLIGMLNHGVLDLHAPVPGLRSRPLLTTTVTWLLRVCMLDVMFDDNFELQQPYLRGGAALRGRFRTAAVMSALLSPFILLFLLMHFLLKHLERIYHHPSSLGKRRWSTYAYWRMREYGELSHFVELRLNSAADAACKYCAQFPSPVTGAVAGLVAYIAAGIAALVISIALTHDYLMERPMWGHTLVWWLAGCGMVLAVARSLMEDEAPTYNPEGAMTEVIAHTHWVPPYWRGKAHSSAVRSEFSGLFQYQVVLYLEEALSVVLLPWLCILLSRSSHDIVSFLHKNTVFHSNVGHVCSMAHFDLDPYGNPRYAPASRSLLDPEARARREKVERSLVSFAACYPSWKPPDRSAARFIDQLDPAVNAAAKAGVVGAGRRAPNDGGGPGGALAASVAVPGAAIGGAWALMSPNDAIPPSVAPNNHSLRARGGNMHMQGLQPETSDLCPGARSIRLPKQSSGRGWGDLDGSGGQEVGSPESDAPSVELQRIGMPPPRPKPRTGALPGGFKKTQDPERKVQQTQHASEVGDAGSEPRRVTYGWVEDAELQDVKPASTVPAVHAAAGAAHSSMHASQESPRDQNCAASEGGRRGQKVRDSSFDGMCLSAGAAGKSTGNRGGAAVLPHPSSPLRVSGSSELEASAVRAVHQDDLTDVLGAPPKHRAATAHSPLAQGIPPQGAAASPGRQVYTPRETSEWAHSSCSLHGGLQNSGSFGPVHQNSGSFGPVRQQSTGSFVGTASGQFASPIGSMAWSGVSGSAAGSAFATRSEVPPPQVGHWHWASSAAHPTVQSTRHSMHSNHSGAEDNMAWVYGVTCHGDDAMFASMRSAMAMQSSMHASVHDTEFRRVYMQAALQRSYNLADSQQMMNMSAQVAGTQNYEAQALARSTPSNSPPVRG